MKARLGGDAATYTSYDNSRPRQFQGVGITGDRPDFRGASGVARRIRDVAAKMGLSPSAGPLALPVLRPGHPTSPLNTGRAGATQRAALRVVRYPITGRVGNRGLRRRVSARPATSARQMPAK